MNVTSPPACILVVEDDQDIRDAILFLLDAEGYRAAGVANGREALDLLNGRAPDRPCLILLDLMMPVMNGWDFLEAQRRSLPLSEIPVCVVSAITDPRRAPPVKHRLAKPIDLNALLAVVTQYC